MGLQVRGEDFESGGLRMVFGLGLIFRMQGSGCSVAGIQPLSAPIPFQKPRVLGSGRAVHSSTRQNPKWNNFCEQLRIRLCCNPLFNAGSLRVSKP